ncbi:hypothetical protein V4D30_08805 [Thermodesulfovibrio sp. 3907-1M]|uniref:Uncharacterized protein n=1 Tax=Thermodesulfovibrio autotrophicus TaxID=3118333 RepID=A0AAU8GYS8_9BACT
MIELEKKISSALTTILLIFLIFTSSAVFAKDFSQEDRERLIRLETTLKEFKESVDKRFEQIDKRFEQIDKRLEFMQNLMIGMLGVFGGLCGVFVGLLLWDRKTFKENAKEEAMKEIEAKYRVGDWITALKEYSKERQDLAEILKKLNLL